MIELSDKPKNNKLRLEVGPRVNNIQTTLQLGHNGQTGANPHNRYLWPNPAPLHKRLTFSQH